MDKSNFNAFFVEKNNFFWNDTVYNIEIRLIMHLILFGHIGTDFIFYF